MTGMYYGVGEIDLTVRTGDSVDVLFNVEINDYKNVQSVQMIVKDIRLSEQFVAHRNAEKERYEEIRRGADFLCRENVLPDRDDFARIYTLLRREFRAGNSVLDLATIMKMVNHSDEEPLNYIKCKYMLRILNELKICEIEELDSDIYRFHVFFHASKTSIEKSSILKKLKSQCKDRVHRDA